MKHVAIVIIVALAFVGCDPVKDLDWDRTAKSQGLRVGNQVKVEGVSYGLGIYKFKKTDNYESVLVKKTWDTEMDLPIYPPDNPVNDVNPNAPIGTVIGTIYNPMHNEVLTELRGMYPDERKMLEGPYLKHKFELIGHIHSFKRPITPDADDTMPDRSLTAVRIHVESLQHIESIDIKE